VRLQSIGKWFGWAFVAALLLASPAVANAATADAAQSTADVSSDISLLWSIPFACLLACIALMPFIAKHWWEHHYPKVAIALAIIPAAYYWLIVRDPWPWLHEMQEYVSFILLLGALYIVSGGIVIQVGRKATPLANCVLLLIGAVIANVFGTTGAAMLLIRPYLRMNRGHIKPYHIVFFIFIVANVGGAVTPIGDPPLFLGYLYGVPFWWVLEHCLWIWIFAVAVLLVVFFIIDTLDHGKADRHHPGDPGPAVRITGIQNFLFVGLIIFGVFQNGIFDVIHRIHDDGWSLALTGKLVFSREILMALAAVGSRFFTAAKIYLHNEFNYGPIREVAILFVGIFSTMVPALQWLGVHANQMPLKTPGQYYFLSGSLSSVLDNAPTYLTFLQVKLSQIDRQQVQLARQELTDMASRQSTQIRDDLPADVRGALSAMVRYHPQDVLKNNVSLNELQIGFLIGDERLNLFLVAVSMGAVFFGACTYIGNGPNFMVKSIADSAGIQTPGFVRYVLVYTLPILIPLYVVVWLLFFL
jgi:Na+/H+ antiporter NhaD/arsenite permease-like protein